jgi:hypothetical protein
MAEGADHLTADRQELLVRWDDELLRGGVILSEWATFLIQDADTAFCAQADLAALLTAQAAMEAHLRYQYADVCGDNVGFARVIEASPVLDDIKRRLHEVRRFRNRWVHVRDPADDQPLLERPDEHRAQLTTMATEAMRLMRELIYQEQCL